MTENLFDPSKLDDEIAMKTDWKPLNVGGGTDFRIQSLKEIAPGRIAFKIRAKSLIFPSTFMIIGILAAIGISLAGLKYFGIPFGSLFFLVGFFTLRSWMTPKVFDYKLGYYWKSRIEPNLKNMQNIQEYCQLSDIHAIQLLQEDGEFTSSDGGKGSFYGYQLNLVLKDGSRLHMIEHRDEPIILNDAKKLAKFLKVPIWDATILSNER